MLDAVQVEFWPSIALCGSSGVGLLAREWREQLQEVPPSAGASHAMCPHTPTSSRGEMLDTLAQAVGLDGRHQVSARL